MGSGMEGHSSQLLPRTSASLVSLGWMISLCLQSLPQLLPHCDGVTYAAVWWDWLGDCCRQDAFLGCVSPWHTAVHSPWCGPGSVTHRQPAAKPAGTAVTCCCWHCPQGSPNANEVGSMQDGSVGTYINTPPPFGLFSDRSAKNSLLPMSSL